ncbi:MAG: flavin reductase [Chloroflexi bacterium]|nr:flavin reductase [Chloroflexota bacterium]
MYAVTAHHGSENGVFLANWLSQCSFEPPLLMLSVENTSHTRLLIEASGLFAVHVLASGQREFAGMLGKSSQTNPAKLKNARWHPSPLTQSPILEDTLGYVECRVRGELPAGDSQIIVGEVIHAEITSDATLAPLTMQETGFKHFG